ncbi:MAG TPA: DegT/DnrJ/EryC1/StrS family aminotransferase [Candidatus Dojkabacteria bacterium]|nr:DegT/DnrJ/EryC1/StrS family aminotransferase [Candidatus Dojkabacteria bacterium]
MTYIPVFSLNRQNRKILPDLNRAIKEVINRGIFILGSKDSEFEAEFAKYSGVKYAAGVASGTDAICLALSALGVKAGDEVILSANSYPTVFAITAIGARPVLVDISASTFNIDPDKIEKAITKKTKAIVAVHLYGQPADF